MNARDMIALLAGRHARDMFFAEVKDGPTYSGAPMRLDAVAIPKSWAPRRLIGYEVKVSRSDWLADRKWESYVDCCSEFWIAAAPGVVKDGEIPSGIGWAEPTKSGKALRTKVKAAFNARPLDADLLLYLLMHRTEPSDGRRRWDSREARAAAWREWLAERKSYRLLGQSVGSALVKRIKELEDKLHKAGSAPAFRESVEAWLKAHGDERGWGSIESRLDDAMGAQAGRIEAARDMLERSVARAIEQLSRSAQKEPSA